MAGVQVLQEYSPAHRPDLPGATDSQLVDFQSRLTDTDRHRLSFLAAGTNTAIEFEIRTDHRDLAKHSRTVTDEHCAFDRSSQLSFLDEISLVHGENEFARRNVNLAAAEVWRINALINRSNDLGSPCNRKRRRKMPFP